MIRIIAHIIAFFKSPLLFFRSKKIVKDDSLKPRNDVRVQPHKREGYQFMTYAERKAKGLINNSHV